ncbi:MAG: tetratricopeptide repeat protein, partial [Thermoanaerobaculum sp.]|nr:tetratricopeptide repeat protein [Thermoanaerobaculum sp.]
DPQRSLELLRLFWDQAPASPRARELASQAREALERQQLQAAQQARLQSLLDEGMALLRQGRLAQARKAFEEVLAVDPDNVLAQRGLELSRGGAARGGRGEAAVQRVGQAPPPVPAVGSARLELYFNSPISQGEFELLLNGSLLGRKAFDFATRGFLGVRRRGSGIVEDAFTVPSGSHTLLVRLKGEQGKVLGEQVFAANFAAGGRYVLRVEMFSEREVPRFALSARK